MCSMDSDFSYEQELLVQGLAFDLNNAEEEIADLYRRLTREQDRAQRLGIALLAAGVPSATVEAIANG